MSNHSYATRIGDAPGTVRHTQQPLCLAAPPPRDELVPRCCLSAAGVIRVIMPFGDWPAPNTCPTPPPLPAQPPAAGAAAGAAATWCAGETNRRFGPKGFGECGGVAVAVTLAGDTQEAKWVCCSLLFEARMPLGTFALVFSTCNGRQHGDMDHRVSVKL